jgi:CHASE2 domain-containing sensor protein
MSLDVATLKRRRAVMMAVNALALLGALAGVVGYFKYAQPLALAGFVAALLVGFGAQIWFIAGLRRPRSSSMSKGA